MSSISLGIWENILLKW